MLKQNDSEVVQAWQEAVRVEVRTRPWFAALLMQKGSRLFDRFVHFYARLTAVGQRQHRRLAIGIGTAALALALSQTPAHAATINVDPGAAGTGIVDDNQCSLVEAIINANNGDQTHDDCDLGSAGADTIVLVGYVSPSSYIYTYNTPFGTDSALPDITSEITIVGNGAIIERNSIDPLTPEFRLITITSSGNLTLNETRITGGSLPAGNGGGIYNNGGRLRLENQSAVYDNESYRGGGIFNDGGTVHVQDSLISDNYAGYSGGGINNTGGTVTINDQSFLFFNTAIGIGGGVANYANGSITANDSFIIGNTAFDYSGGGIANIVGNVALNDSLITGNVAGTSGGGLFNAGSGTAVLNNSRLYTNEADNGGGIYNEGSLTLNQSTLSGNYAYSSGGGVYNNAILNLNQSTLSGNEAFLTGGGLHNSASGTAMIERSTLYGNTAYTQDGGGIYNAGTLTLNQSTLSGNDTFSDGGGIHNSLGGYTSLTNSTVSANYTNSSGRGGGIHNDGSMVLRNSTISENIAETGGGFNNGQSGDVTLTNSTVSRNNAQFGGGLWNSGDMTLNNSTISGNTGSMFGGIHNVGVPYGTTGVMVLNRTIVSGNTGGGANEISNYLGEITAANNNVFGHSGQTDAEAFSDFAPTGSDVNATSDGTGTPLANILDITLADNGGPTLTHALVSGSPAIDIAPAANCASAPINGLDQRGVVRSQDGNADGTAACDAGAVEMGQLQCGIQSATLPFLLTFAQASDVSVNVTDAGTDLDCVRVTEIGQDHPEATSSMINMALQTGRYWQIAGYQNNTSDTPATTDFTVDLTLPFATADTNSRACKWLGVTPPTTGFGWDCGEDADNEEVTDVSVTRLNYTGGFSDWAVGDEVGPTAVSNLSTQTNTPNQAPLIPLLATLLTLLSGAWLWLTRPQRF